MRSPPNDRRRMIAALEGLRADPAYPALLRELRLWLDTELARVYHEVRLRYPKSG